MFPKYKTHVCFVSGQNMPNLLLAFNEKTRPEKVYLLASADMKENAKTVAQNFKNMKIAVEKVDLPSLSFKELKDFIEGILEPLDNNEGIENIAFNLTGGTKLMTLAADKACSGLGIARFYVDTFSDVVTMLNNDQEFPMENYVTVLNILNSYGYKSLKRQESTVQSKELIAYFLGMKYPRNIMALNKAAVMAAKDAQCTAQMDIYSQNEEMFDACKKAQMLDYHGRTIGFKSKDARRFCNGEWLEHHVAHTLKQLQNEKKIHDYEQSLEVTFLDNKVADQNELSANNELDALFVHKNILYVIECKTAQMDESGKVRPILYKLDALCDSIGGVLSKKIIISYLPLSDQEKENAKKSNVIVIDDQKDIRNLRKTLIEIIQPKR